MAQDDTKKSWSMRTFTTVGNSVYVLFIAGICALVGMLPLIIVWCLVHGDLITYYPLTLVALALSTPGIAALFAVFRDQPTISSRGGTLRSRVLDNGYEFPAWVARPYLSSDDGTAFIRPFARAYRRIGVRALIVGGTYALALFALIYDMQILTQFSWGILIVPALGVLCVMLVQAMLVSLVLVVEYPLAKWVSVIRNGVLLSVRRIYMLPISAIALLGYVWGLSYKPILVVCLASGITAYIVWASSRWQADLMFGMLAQGSGDPVLIDLYGHHGSSTRSLPSMADYRQ